MVVIDSTLRNCTAGRYGGGVIATGASTVLLKRVLIIDSHATGLYDPDSRSGGGGGFRGTGGAPILTDVAIINCTSWGLEGGAAISSEVPVVALNLSVIYTCGDPPEGAPASTSIFHAIGIEPANQPFAFRRIGLQRIGCDEPAVAEVHAISNGMDFATCSDGSLVTGGALCGPGAECAATSLVFDTSSSSDLRSGYPLTISCICGAGSYANDGASALVAGGSDKSSAAYDSGCLTARQAVQVAVVTQDLQLVLYKSPNASMVVVGELTVFLEGTDPYGSNWIAEPPSEGWLALAELSGAAENQKSTRPEQMLVQVQANASGLYEKRKAYQTNVVLRVASMVNQSFIVPASLVVTAKTFLPKSSWVVVSRDGKVAGCNSDWPDSMVKVGVAEEVSFQACDLEALPVDHQLPSGTDSRRLAAELKQGENVIVTPTLTCASHALALPVPTHIPFFERC